MTGQDVGSQALRDIKEERGNRSGIWEFGVRRGMHEGNDLCKRSRRMDEFVAGFLIELIH